MAEIAIAYAKTGNAQEAQNLIKRVRTLDKTNVNYIYEEAVIDALLGRGADALKVLQDALQKHYPAEFAAGDPDLGTLQNNPEFQGLIKKYSEKKP